jgi:hypothetical protein
MSTHHATNALQLIMVTAMGALLTLAPPAASATSAAAQPDIDAFVASLEGGWSGENNTTPFGAMPFAVLFERTDDGSLYSRSSLNSETYIELELSKDEAGRWILHEGAAMEGMGSHRYSLVPADGAGDMHRWIYEKRPGFLTIDIGLEDDTMLMEVALRGNDHIRFELDRLSEEETTALRQELLIASETPPGDGNSIRDVVESFPGRYGGDDESADADDPIAQARESVSDSPDDANAHLALAKALGAAINSDPANGPLYAGEMYRSLKTSIELDPRLAEAYHWLVGYFMSAPEIAGGSLVMAEETARKLAEFDAEGAKPLLEEIASRKATVQ